MIKKYLSNLSSDKPKVKYPTAKRLIAIAEKNPHALYPHMTFFVKLLKSENNILKWTAIDIIGYLSRVAKKNRVDKLFNVLIGFLHNGKLITANHAIAALTHIALSKPEYQDKITCELLKVENCKYDTEECRNIAVGKVVQALGTYIKQSKHDPQVLEFVKRQTASSRSATRKKAEKFLNTRII